MSGTTLAAGISGSLDAKHIVMRVLQGAVELTDLLPLCAQVDVPKLTGTVPVYSVPAGDEDLEEFETSDIGGSDFTYVDFSLKKDRVKVAVSDEAQFKSNAGNPLSLQENGASSRLAQLLNKKIVAAAEVTPQTGDGADWTSTNNPLADIGTAVAAIAPFKADRILMGTAAFAAYVSNASIAAYGSGNVASFNNAVAVVPGYNIPIQVSTEATSTSVYVVATKAPGLVLGKGPVKVRRKDLLSGGEVYQIDVWRQVKSTIHDTGSTTNKGVYVITGVTS